MGRRLAIPALLTAAVSLLFARPAFAAAGFSPGVIDGIINTFNAVTGFQPTLLTAAEALFGGLFVIEFTLVVGRAVLARADLGGILTVVLMQMITAGFFWWVLVNGAAMIGAIINSFAQLGSTATGTSMHPTDIFNTGLSIVKVMWGGMAATTPGKDILLAFGGIVVLYVFARIAAMIVEVIVESMFTTTVSVVLLGFGGSSYTRQLAVAQLYLAISVGVKRLVLELIVGLAASMVQGWAATPASSLDWQTIAAMIGAPIVLFSLAQTLPQRAQDVMAGAYGGGTGNLLSTAGSVASGAAGAAASVAGGGAAVGAAFRQASATIAAREAAGSGGSISSGGASSAIGRAMQVTAGAAKSLGGAAASDIGQRMSGSYAAQHGRMGWRMASSMSQSAANLRAAVAGSGQGGMPAGNAQAAGNQVGTP